MVSGPKMSLVLVMLVASATITSSAPSASRLDEIERLLDDLLLLEMRGAARPQGFGMTAELNHASTKYDEDLATTASNWITAVTGIQLGDASEANLQEELKSGVTLCKLMNVLQPGSVPKINEVKMAFKQMENINNFINAAGKYGVKTADLFQTVDLYEGQNMAQVVNGIIALGRQAQNQGFDGPSIGPKEATEGNRFTQEQLAAGQNDIGLQMGSNKGPSQADHYGRDRQVAKTGLKTRVIAALVDAGYL